MPDELHQDDDGQEHVEKSQLLPAEPDDMTLNVCVCMCR